MATDITENFAQMVNLEGTHWFNDKIELSGNVYYRSVDTSSFNSDTSDFTPDGLGFLLDDGNPVLDQNGAQVPDTFNALNNVSQRTQRSYGGAAQTTFLQRLFEHDNQFIMGLNWNQGFVDFNAQLEAAQLLPSRVTTTGSNIFIPDEATGLSGRTRTASAYFTDTLALTDKLYLTVSGRYNDTRIVLADTLGTDPQINGRHDFARFNPAVGATWQFMPWLRMTSSVPHMPASRFSLPVRKSKWACSNRLKSSVPSRQTTFPPRHPPCPTPPPTGAEPRSRQAARGPTRAPRTPCPA